MGEPGFPIPDYRSTITLLAQAISPKRTQLIQRLLVTSWAVVLCGKHPTSFVKAAGNHAHQTFTWPLFPTTLRLNCGNASSVLEAVVKHAFRNHRGFIRLLHCYRQLLALRWKRIMANLPTLKPATDHPPPDAESAQARQPIIRSGVRTSSACLSCRKRRTKVSIGHHIRQSSIA
jgi:hypothetical protein